VINQLGLLLIVLSTILSGVALWEVIEYFRGAERELIAMEAMLISTGVGLAFGGWWWWLGRAAAHDTFGRREAMLLVGVSWLIGAALSALPFWIWAHLFHADNAEALRAIENQPHPFLHYIDCYFEAMSGLTTTGATVLSNIEGLPRGLLLWRSLTHWLGGLGIVVLFVAVLPTLGVGGKRLFHTEAPGPKQAGVRPRVKDTARVLWFIYLAMTVAALLSYRLAGMPWFDSLCHSMSTVSTGGLSPSNSSIAGYNAVAVDLVSMVFMLLAGVNFVLFYHVVRGQPKLMWKDPELRVYLLLKFIVIAIIAVDIVGITIHTIDGLDHEGTVGQALRYSGFTTIALHTGTGFCTADYDQWPFLSRSLLFGLMFVGGCAGSTAGGIKVIRFWIVLRVLFTEVERIFRPNVIRPLKVGGRSIDTEVRDGAMVYVMIFMSLFVLGGFLIRMFELGNPESDFGTAFSASLSTISNVGPGLFGIGASKNYGWMTDASKALLSLWMALGRLEVFAIFVLFVPRFWKTE